MLEVIAALCSATAMYTWLWCIGLMIRKHDVWGCAFIVLPILVWTIPFLYWKEVKIVFLVHVLSWLGCLLLIDHLDLFLTIMFRAYCIPALLMVIAVYDHHKRLSRTRIAESEN